MVTDGVILKFAKSGAGPGPAPLRPHLRNGFWHEGQKFTHKEGWSQKARSRASIRNCLANFQQCGGRGIRMRSTYLVIATAAALIHSAAHFDQQDLTAKASEPPLGRAKSSSGDAATEGELLGTVTLAGQAPRNHTINMAADPECAKSHAGPVTSEEVVVGAANALANVIIYISEGLGTQSFDPPKEPVVMEQKGCQYQGHVVAIEAGQKLRVENSDATSHNIHPIPANNREWNRSQPQG